MKKHVRTFESFRNNKGLEPINEEFILGLLKGALSKVMAAFGKTFGDLTNDFKNAFKADDPTSIKGIILTNFNQAIDDAQKLINDKEVDEAGVNDLINKMADNLVSLATGIDKDIDAAIGKDKSAGAKAIAKAIILGSKEAGWVGIVGLIDPTKGKSEIKTTYKYSKLEYGKAIALVADLPGKKSAAIKFLDSMQADIKNQLDKEFSEDEINKIYNDSMKKAGQSNISFIVGDSVIYKREKFNEEEWKKLTPEDKKKLTEGKMKELIDKEMIGLKKVSKIEGDKVSFEGADFTKDKKDILGKSEFEVRAEGQEDLTKKLGELKTKKPDDIKKVSSFVDFISKEENKDKIEQIDKILNGE